MVSTDVPKLVHVKSWKKPWKGLFGSLSQLVGAFTYSKLKCSYRVIPSLQRSAVPNPDPEIRGGGRGGHPDPKKRGGGPDVPKDFSSDWSKNKGGGRASPLNPPLVRSRNTYDEITSEPRITVLWRTYKTTFIRESTNHNIFGNFCE